MISGVKYLSWACWPLHIFLRKIYIYNLYPSFNWLVFLGFWASCTLGSSVSSVQFSHSVVSDSLWFHDRSTPGLPVDHQHLEFTQTHVHRVGDAIQPSHPLSPSFLPAAQSLPASEPFPMNQLLAWGGQTTGVSALSSFLPKNTQGCIIL